MQQLCSRFVDRTVRSHDTTEDGSRVRIVRFRVSFQHVCTDTYATRIHVLNCNNCRLAELFYDLKSCVRVIDIVVR
ncbi:hypothetical protein D3C84_940990 [compost metagenome]